MLNFKIEAAAVVKLKIPKQLSNFNGHFLPTLISQLKFSARFSPIDLFELELKGSVERTLLT